MAKEWCLAETRNASKMLWCATPFRNELPICLRATGDRKAISSNIHLSSNYSLWYCPFLKLSVHMVIVWTLGHHLNHEILSLGDLFRELPPSPHALTAGRVGGATRGGHGQCTEQLVEVLEQQSKLTKAVPEMNREAKLMLQQSRWGEEAWASVVTTGMEGVGELGSSYRSRVLVGEIHWVPRPPSTEPDWIFLCLTGPLNHQEKSPFVTTHHRNRCLPKRDLIKSSTCLW